MDTTGFFKKTIMAASLASRAAKLGLSPDMMNVVDTILHAANETDVKSITALMEFSSFADDGTVQDGTYDSTEYMEVLEYV